MTNINDVASKVSDAAFSGNTHRDKTHTHCALNIHVEVFLDVQCGGEFEMQRAGEVKKKKIK